MAAELARSYNTRRTTTAVPSRMIMAATVSAVLSADRYCLVRLLMMSGTVATFGWYVTAAGSGLQHRESSDRTAAICRRGCRNRRQHARALTQTRRKAPIEQHIDWVARHLVRRASLCDAE